MRNLRSRIAAIMTAGLLLANNGCAPPTAAQTADRAAPTRSSLDRVTAGKPTRKTLKINSSQPGRAEAFEQTPLHTKLAAYVQEVLVDIGDPVKRNQPLVILRIPELRDELKQKEALVALAEAEVRQAEASVEAAEAAAESAHAKVGLAEAGVGRAEGEFDRWEGELRRIKQLAESGSVTKKLLDETLNQFRAAEATQRETTASIQSAQAGLKETQVNIRKAKADTDAAAARLEVARANLAETTTLNDYATILAPFDGVVTRRTVDTGHFVQPAGGGSSQPLVTVARVDKIRVSFDVPEMESPWVDVGDPATVRVQSLASVEFKTQVARTSWSLETANRSLRTEVDIENAKGRLRPGMYAMVNILLEQRDNVLTVPVTAVGREGDTAFCCVVANAKIERRTVELGLRSGDEVEILSGLEENELLVLTRIESLKDGQQVDVASPTK